jgi:ribonuclease HIII
MRSDLSPELTKVVAGLQSALSPDGISLAHTVIDYGVKLSARDEQGQTAAVTLYHSAKKQRYRLVVAPDQDGDLLERIRSEAARLCQTDFAGPRPPGSTPDTPVSGHQPLERHLALVLPRLHAEGLFPHDIRPVPYGLRLEFTVGQHRGVVTMYHSAKNGLTIVAAKGQPLAERIAGLMQPDRQAALPRSEQRLSAWIGTDEAGKGDYFGPLVVTAVHLQGQLRQQVAHIGVMDSKRLADARLVDMARRLRGVLGDHTATVVIGPPRYNELMSGPRRRGLNDLLAWAHGRAVHDLVERGLEIDAVVVDRFADAAVIERQMPPGLRILARPRAEDNPAVAAASILARATYLRQLQRLADDVGIDLRPGAGPAVIDIGRALVRQHGPEVLAAVAKHHFHTTETILSRL